MTFRLTKHHGLGNDFLVFLTDDASRLADRDTWTDRAVRWCDRRRGIGADGLLLGLVGPAADSAASGSPAVDVVMTLVNGDGSTAEMSGNGIRCLAQAEARRRSDSEGELVILTDGGIRSVRYRPEPAGDPATVVASVDMGPAGPGPEPDLDPTSDLSTAHLSEATATELALPPMRSATFDLGNPHLVLLVEDPDAIDLASAGATHEAAFSAGMNVHFVAPTTGEKNAMSMRVWERGAGITRACGTGATAVARAAYDWGLVGPEVTVHMPGGDVVVEVADRMTLHGPAAFIATVEVDR